ncbi:MAG TPA: metallophosphoesterase family protein [Verrucomicrobiota bacterium]|nr:YfcE family phosphodiesterase [Verrucomicrobiales bacterium]HRI11602.1 metallophosphoesterase family protein [Verrucomicrobiota bacterium]
MLVGLISDTHGHLDRRVFELFAGVDRILHAGDIGYPSLILELESIAPVTAVLGNNDHGLDFKLTEVLEVAGQKILVHHIVNPSDPARSIGERFQRSNPGFVVFGHTHQPFHQTKHGVTFLNPGYSGKPRFGLPRSVATARFVVGQQPEVTFHSL